MNYIISKQLINELVSFLGNKSMNDVRYVEIQKLITQLAQLEPVERDDEVSSS